MKPIVCLTISQAWKVKAAYDDIGNHVRIVKAHPVRDPKKVCWVCYIENSPPQPPQNAILNSVLSFCDRMVAFKDRGTPATHQLGDTNGKT